VRQTECGVSGRSILLSVSHGIAMLDHTIPSFDEGCHRADSGMYAARRRVAEMRAPVPGMPHSPANSG
jgi:GGDEF domain-containing protein